jgi:hypothetical protein
MAMASVVKGGGDAGAEKAPLVGAAPYRAGVIGLGYVGAGDDVSGAAIGQAVLGKGQQGLYHSGAYATNPRVQLVAGSSRNLGRRERFESRHPGVTTCVTTCASVCEAVFH